MALKVVILGAGVMGRGLARQFSRAGAQVAICEPSDVARQTLTESLCVAAPKDLGPSWTKPDLVIEAVPERLDLKHKVFADCEAFFEPEVIFASNTSAIPTALLAQGLRHPERLAIAHFFNPADVIPVVEVIGAEAMPEERLQELAKILRALGKEPAILRKEMPGFVANRIQHAMMRECLHLLDEGVADAETLDAVIRWSIGVRLAFSGPFLQRDLNGLDTHLSIANFLYPELSAAQSASPSLAEPVAKGHLGRKIGRGYYDWSPEREAATRAAEAALADLIADLRQKMGA